MTYQITWSEVIGYTLWLKDPAGEWNDWMRLHDFDTEEEAVEWVNHYYPKAVVSEG